VNAAPQGLQNLRSISLSGLNISPALGVAWGAFVILYASPFIALATDWWTMDDAAHGLLLFPLALWLGWKQGIDLPAREQPVLGSAIIGAAVVLNYLADLAAEVFSLRVSMLMAAAGLVVFSLGFRQLLRWWLPALLLGLCIPLPDIVLSAIAFPLQIKASAIGATMLEWRNVPVILSGNVIQLPGQTLFVTEACSGLRSLSALIALGLVVSGLWLKRPALRFLLIVLSIPVAVAVNGFRVFLTGYLIFFSDPALATGFMHLTEGWILFLSAFAILGWLTALFARGERWLDGRVHA